MWPQLQIRQWGTPFPLLEGNVAVQTLILFPICGMSHCTQPIDLTRLC